MRVAATLGLGLSTRLLRPFACNCFTGNKVASWKLGLPASPSDADAILIFGGDGTVHRHLAQLRELQLPVLVVPCGSGNDFARALQLRHVRDSIEAWQRFCSHQDNVRQIDLGVISHAPQRDAVSLPAEPRSEYFCCVGGVGLDVEIARRANRLPRWIRLGKWMAKARIDIKAQGMVQTRQGTFRADGALNPLDLSLLPENCNIVAMAPASLITNVFSTGSYYEFEYDEGGRKRTIRLPMEMSYRPGRNARLFA